MNLSTKTFDELLEKTLCKKFVYDACLPLETSVKLADLLIETGDKDYDLSIKNCEHTVRLLKTGTIESIQVEETVSNIIRSLAAFSPKIGRFLAGAGAKSFLLFFAERLGDSLCNRVAPFLDFKHFGAEMIVSLIIFSFLYLWNIIELETQRDKGEISQENFEDLRTILRYTTFGEFVGWIAIPVGMMFCGAAAPMTLLGFGGICIGSMILSGFGRVLFNWLGHRAVRNRHERNSILN